VEPASAETSWFPLIPHRRLVGLTVGALSGSRRGRGYEVIGSRPYRPGDDMRAIDWAASARLSSSRDDDLFLVRVRYVEEAPHVVVICDHRPSMSLYSETLPWLSKPRVAAYASELIASSALAARGFLGYLDIADAEPLWRPPRRQRRLPELELERPYTARADVLERAFEHLRLHRRSVPAGSFVFVVSDFLDPPGDDAWIEMRDHRWDLVPVVVQDPVWEQSFPDVAGVVVPLADPRDGRIRLVRLTGDEVEARRRAHEQRLAELLEGLRAQEIEPVLISTERPDDILEAFLEWADVRIAAKAGLW
jgi:uncharacterized protein (DUF58 family)